MAIVGFDTSLLLNYYASRQPQTGSPATGSAHAAATNQVPPWDISIKKPAQTAEDVSARSSDPYFDPKDKALKTSATAASTNSSSQLEALLKSTLSTNSTSAGANPSFANDNDKLFALYKALDRLGYIAGMANREGTFDSQRPGLNKDFQNGLAQVQAFLKTASFSNLTVTAAKKASSAQASISIPYADTVYNGGAVASDKKVLDPVAGVSATDSFTISFTKGGTTTDVAIDLANVSGPLTIDNINAYVNQQLKAAGSGTRFARIQTGGVLTDGTASWGIKVASAPSEKVALSSASAAPAIYVAGSAGTATAQQGKLIKLTDLSGTQTSAFSANIVPDSGTAAAKATAVDANGNVYVVGNSTGSFGSEINQASQDVFLSKYDSAGNVQWTKLLGSADSAGAFGLAVDPTSGGVVIAGAVTGDLSPAAIGGGTDSFVAKYNGDGDQLWQRQVSPAANDQANSVSVDAAGNIYVGGQTAASGAKSAGGTDATITKLSKTGSVVYERQFGTAGTDSVAQTAIAADGNLVVASIQNGHAILAKYSAGDGVSTPVWQIDLGDIQGGMIGGIASANGRIYLTGSSASVSLDAGGAATIAHANSGGTDAFVFAATDAGASATADFVSYAGTGASDQGGGIAVAGDKLYLTGTTTGTFSGETRNATGTHNQFVTQLSTDGSIDWTHQYGGVDGESTGVSIAADASGSSVLDALKLPRGTIDTNQSNSIETQTTARAGDYFTLKISDKTGTRESKVTISKGETLRSLAVKINGALLFSGKAKTLGVKGGQGLSIAVNAGVNVQLIAGPKDFDALAGLGLAPQTLINDGTANSTSSSKSTSSTGSTSSSTDSKASTSSGPQTVGLGIDSAVDLLNKSNASHAQSVVLAAQSLIKQAYSKLNAPPGSTSPTQPTGQVPAYLQNQTAGYQTALAWLNTVNGTSG